MSPAVLLSLLRRYIRVNLVLQGRPGPLPGPVGTTQGQIDTLTLSGGLLTVTGACPTGGDIVLELGEMSSHMPLPATGGAFRLTLPWLPGLAVGRNQARLIAPDGQTADLPLPHPALPILRLALRFCGVMLRGVPDLWAWLRHRDLGARTRLKDALGLGPQRPGGPAEPPQQAQSEWFRVDVAGIQPQMPYDLLPFYLMWQPEGEAVAQTALPYRTAVEFDLSEGIHLSYAVQWFLFAAMFGVGYVYYVRKDMRERTK